MSVVWLGLIQMLFTWLSNDEFQDAVISRFDKIKDDPTNAVNPEWIEGQAKSINERLKGEKPADGNVFLPQDQIELIKKAHRPDPSTHEVV